MNEDNQHSLFNQVHLNSDFLRKKHTFLKLKLSAVSSNIQKIILSFYYDDFRSKSMAVDQPDGNALCRLCFVHSQII